MSGHRYRVTYKVEWKVQPEGLSREQVGALGDGTCATDALALVSILYPADGSYSVLPNSIDGRTGKPLTSDELFKMVLTLLAGLSRNDDLSKNKREFCIAAVDAYFGRAPS